MWKADCMSCHHQRSVKAGVTCQQCHEHPARVQQGRGVAAVKGSPSAMAAMGWCPSGRLFEAAACGAAILSDWWEGLDAFFEPGREILIARSTNDALAALDRSPEEIVRLSRRARERVLAEHTSAHRAQDLLTAIEGARSAPQPVAAEA